MSSKTSAFTLQLCFSSSAGEIPRNAPSKRHIHTQLSSVAKAQEQRCLLQEPWWLEPVPIIKLAPPISQILASNHSLPDQNALCLWRLNTNSTVAKENRKYSSRKRCLLCHVLSPWDLFRHRQTNQH